MGQHLSRLFSIFIIEMPHKSEDYKTSAVKYLFEN